jgi:ParB family transcriptional regulator, chromosome partitioning protein
MDDRIDIARRIDLDDIQVPPRLRALRPEKVEELANSMREIGLLNPITLRLTLSGHQLVAGLHRFEGARKLGWKRIPAIVLDDLDAVDADTISGSE